MMLRNTAVGFSIAFFAIVGCEQQAADPTKPEPFDPEQAVTAPDPVNTARRPGDSDFNTNPEVEINKDTAIYEPTSSFDESQIGLPLYTGAEPQAGGTWKLTDSMSEGAESISSMRFLTPDSFDKVAEFYRERLQPNPDQVFEFEGPKGKTLSLTIESELYASANIILKEHKKGTRIEISLMGRKLDIKQKIIKEIITTN